VTPRIPVTLELIGFSALIALVITFPVATLAAARRGRLADQAIRLAFTSALGIPSFWLGVVLALLLGVKVRLFPIAGAGNGFGDRLYHLTLPAVTIAISIAPLLVRALRSSLIEVMSSDFVITGRASGLRPRFLIWSYMLRNSLLPLVTILSINLGWVVGGTVIVEQVFGIPGIGSLLIAAISTRDYSIIQLVTLILALFVVSANLFTDLAYALFDPRVELRAT
jgi:peptide/nickel transport system permease protein